MVVTLRRLLMDHDDAETESDHAETSAAADNYRRPRRRSAADERTERTTRLLTETLAERCCLNYLCGSPVISAQVQPMVWLRQRELERDGAGGGYALRRAELDRGSGKALRSAEQNRTAGWARRCAA